MTIPFSKQKRQTPKEVLLHGPMFKRVVQRLATSHQPIDTVLYRYVHFVDLDLMFQLYSSSSITYSQIQYHLVKPTSPTHHSDAKNNVFVLRVYTTFPHCLLCVLFNTTLLFAVCVIFFISSCNFQFSVCLIDSNYLFILKCWKCVHLFIHKYPFLILIFVWNAFYNRLLCFRRSTEWNIECEFLQNELE